MRSGGGGAERSVTAARGARGCVGGPGCIPSRARISGPSCITSPGCIANLICITSPCSITSPGCIAASVASPTPAVPLILVVRPVPGALPNLVALPSQLLCQPQLHHQGSCTAELTASPGPVVSPAPAALPPWLCHQPQSHCHTDGVASTSHIASSSYIANSSCIANLRCTTKQVVFPKALAPGVQLGPQFLVRAGFTDPLHRDKTGSALRSKVCLLFCKSADF